MQKGVSHKPRRTSKEAVIALDAGHSHVNTAKGNMWTEYSYNVVAITIFYVSHKIQIMKTITS